MTLKPPSFDILLIVRYSNDMNTDIIQKLSIVSLEEKAILDGKHDINQDDYSLTKDFVINSVKLLGDKQIDLRLHTRFVDFPLHGHDYLEVMYVYAGTVTHIINGQEVILQSGDIIFLNRHIKHAIKKASLSDIGINFVVSDLFLNYIRNSIENNELMSAFISENLNPNGLPEYLHFKTNDIFPIRNLLDNLIFAIVNHTLDDYNIVIQLMSLLFAYLSYYQSSLVNTYRSTSEIDVKRHAVMEYISKKYVEASLAELAKYLGYSQEYLSRWIKEQFGHTFKELLMDTRLRTAEKLLRTTDMSVSEIINAVGYDNQSHFHKLFLITYGSTPHQYRLKLHNKS